MNLPTAFQAMRELGVRPIWLYGRYLAGLRSGMIRRRTPRYAWEERPLGWWLLPEVPTMAEGYAAYRAEHPVPVLIVPTGGPGSRRWITSNLDPAVREANAILNGSFPVFGDVRQACGFPPDWGAFLPPAPRGMRLDSQPGHWTDRDLERLPADVKLVWELSRFGWVYPLARAYARTRDPRYPEACMALIDSWMRANPPNTGMHWASGQEAAFRLLSVSFAVQALASWTAAHSEALVRLAGLVAVHADRIPATLSYARAQGNNHLLVEATALLTAGTMFPEMRQAGRWTALGRRWLETGLKAQFFEDGGYVQHSSNYHRLALETGLWAARLCGIAGRPLSAKSLEALRRGAICLQALVDPRTGQASNFGPNDGAHLLRLSDCAHDDYRPTLQLAWQVLRGERLYPPGPWDEVGAWLGVGNPVWPQPAPRPWGQGSSRPAAPRRLPPETSVFPQAGLHRLDGDQSWAILRCAHFATRPGHADQLHVDLWWRAIPLAADSGSYLYNAPPPWDNALSGASAHNTVVVDSRDPMLRAGRFLWLRWAQGKIIGRWEAAGARAMLLSGEHSGYGSLGVVHRRSLLYLAPDDWWVVDELLGGGEHTASLTWRLADGPWVVGEQGVAVETNVGRVQVSVEAPAAALSVYRCGERLAGAGGDEPVRGWSSPAYSVLRPTVELVTRCRGSLPLRYITHFRLGDRGKPDAVIEWRDAVGDGPPVRGVRQGRFTWVI